MTALDEATSSYVDGDAWVCIFCTARNGLAAEHCGGCGLSFAGGRPASTTVRRPRLGELAARTLHPAAEAALAVVLFLLWRLADVFAGAHAGGAVSRGRSLAHVERVLGLPTEASFQHPFLGHHALERVLNVFYVAGHVPALAVFAVWLYWRHREDFGRWRTRFVAATAVAFAVQLVTVAPPRLVPGLGVVDTARQLGESVYSRGSGGFADQFATFPSVHVLWAVLVAAAVVSLNRSRFRWLAVLHPVATVVTVVATGNHFWLDALAAGVLALAVRPIGVVTKSSQTNFKKFLKDRG